MSKTDNNNHIRNGIHRPCRQASIKSRSVYIILGLLCGGWGIHNFYAGYMGRGIAQLLIVVLAGWRFYPLAVIVGAWVIIEICTVTKDAEGNSLS